MYSCGLYSAVYGNKKGQFVGNNFWKQFLKHALYLDTIECKFNKRLADCSLKLSISNRRTGLPNFTVRLR